MPQLKSLHRYLVRRAFYPLVLCSILACTLYAGRVYLSRSPVYFFMVWNLFLAWVPYWWSLWGASLQRRAPGQPFHLILPGALWLLFFPNAPYIVTDLVHLHRHSNHFPWWYDLGMIFAFAWTGWLLAITSLQMMQEVVERAMGRVASWLFVMVAALLSGVGIYLGRFLRWNSWDALLNPRGVLQDVITPLLDPLTHRQPVGVILVFAALLFVSYLCFATTRQAPRQAAGFGD